MTGGAVVSARNDVAELYCRNITQRCDYSTFITLQHLNAPLYNLSISFDLTGIPQKIFDQTSIEVWVADERYTLFAILLRYVFLGISIVGCLVYWLQVRSCRDVRLRTEHRRIMFLSIALIFFNDPIYAWTLIRPSIALGVISVLFVANFYRELLYAWATVWWKAKVGQEGTIPNGIRVVIWTISLLFFAFLATESVLYDVYTYFAPSIFGQNT